MRWLDLAEDLELQELVVTAAVVELHVVELRRKLHVVGLAEVLGQRHVAWELLEVRTCRWNCLSRNGYG
eukprot:6704920-Heterocapsa_arctica.AAC.1